MLAGKDENFAQVRPIPKSNSPKHVANRTPSNVPDFRSFDLTLNLNSVSTDFGRKNPLASRKTFRYFLFSSLGICIYRSGVECSYDGPNRGMRIQEKTLHLSFVSNVLHSVVTKYNKE